VVAAGDSLGGAVTLQLALDAPERIRAAVIACSGPKIGTVDGWHQRAADVLAGGLEPGGVVREATPGRWFGPGFADRQPDLAQQVLGELSTTDPQSYAACCGALAGFDLRDRLAEVTVPVLAVAGSVDQVTPTALLRHVASGVQQGRLVELPGVAHLAPAEAPEQLAVLIVGQADAQPAAALTVQQVAAQGMRVRRQVLGDEHVDRAGTAVTDLNTDFQELITRYAWGSIWTRPGLDRRSRSIAVLTALVARGHHEELAMHVRGALRNGLTVDEIKEVLLQSAIYCGVPDANTAFRIAGQVLEEES
jgi:3-oxoadipate enol-lactonase/4-carboxymuconolactone decarboxylase